MKRSFSGENPTSGEGSTEAPHVSHMFSSATGSVAGSSHTHARRTSSAASVSSSRRRWKDAGTTATIAQRFETAGAPAAARLAAERGGVLACLFA